MNPDRIGYWIKSHCRPLYGILEAAVGRWVALRYRQDIRRAASEATLHGSVDGQDAVIRLLSTSDLDALATFFAGISDRHLRFFRPHGFSRTELLAVLRKPSYLLYGLFVHDELVGYCTLKLFPGRKSFRGRLVGESWAGRGIGHFLSRYISWQVGLLGFRARSTISRKNLPSLKSHEVEGAFTVISELPDNYMLIEFHDIPHHGPPVLLLDGG